jgi:nucleoside phosphorylase
LRYKGRYIVVGSLRIASVREVRVNEGMHPSIHQTDANVYTWGRRMGSHNIVIASPASGNYGTTSATTTASSLLASLPSIRVGVLVGIGGGIARPDEGYDIRLGDVVVGPLAASASMT